MNLQNAANLTIDELKQILNKETGKIAWPELQRHYARGAVIAVSAELDLVEVAFHINQDDTKQVEQWLQSGQLKRATEEDAERWHNLQSTFWAVVVAPWVLAQEYNEQ